MNQIKMKIVVFTYLLLILPCICVATEMNFLSIQGDSGFRDTPFSGFVPINPSYNEGFFEQQADSAFNGPQIIPSSNSGAGYNPPVEVNSEDITAENFVDISSASSTRTPATPLDSNSMLFSIPKEIGQGRGAFVILPAMSPLEAVLSVNEATNIAKAQFPSLPYASTTPMELKLLLNSVLVWPIEVIAWSEESIEDQRNSGRFVHAIVNIDARTGEVVSINYCF